MWHWVVCSTLSTWRSLTSFMEIFYSSFPNVTVVACLGTAGEHLKLSLQRQRWLTCPECVSSVEIAAEQRGEERRWLHHCKNHNPIQKLTHREAHTIWSKGGWTSIFMHCITMVVYYKERPCNVLLNVSYPCVSLQWTAVQTGQWTTWSTGCCRASRCGWSALCSMVTSGPTTARRRAWASASCGTAALASATATLRSPSLSTACAWARRRTPSGSDRQTSRTWACTPVCYGR